MIEECFTSFVYESTIRLTWRIGNEGLRFDLQYAHQMTSAGTILVVCTGNVCRSPYIEHLLSHRLADLGIEVSSAGTMALVDQPMQVETAALLAKLGIDDGGFEARQLVPAFVEHADLVLTATREHRKQVVRTAPRGLRYTFAVDDFSDLVADADLSAAVWGEAPDDTAATKLVRRAVARRADVTPRPASDCGIIDPYRQRSSAFEKMADQVAQVLPAIEQALQQVAMSH